MLFPRLDVRHKRQRVAAGAFTELLNDAKRTMLISDDGNENGNNMQTRSTTWTHIINAVKARLTENKDLDLMRFFGPLR